MIVFTISANSSNYDIKLDITTIGGVQYDLLFQNVNLEFVANMINGVVDLDKFISIKFSGRNAETLRSLVNDETMVL
jgi:hypothetical protein